MPMPNVLYTLDTSTDSIRYTTTRDIALGEELCIFYGHKLWFVSSEASNMDNQSEELEDVWGGLLAVVDSADPTGPYLDGDPQAFIEDEDLPFTRYKLPPEEEDMESIRTGTSCAPQILVSILF
ncbi:hypothetical protein H0H81_001020 [Sphagnurus paluster]|uniref:SET domain-containing protein n=1 Tax=Sphagnurus paluster TaxID=117069 RepID=A0A9P7K7X9_9AGAR|nr:hypothetical protein H0H81_001020 [Sphagnurus paluster]